MRRRQVFAATALLCLVASCAALASAERVWLRVNTDKSLGAAFDWLEFAAPKGEPLREVLDKRLGGARRDAPPAAYERAADGNQLHLYRLEPLDLEATADELKLKSGDKFYLTDKDLLST